MITARAHIIISAWIIHAPSVIPRGEFVHRPKLKSGSCIARSIKVSINPRRYRCLLLLLVLFPTPTPFAPLSDLFFFLSFLLSLPFSLLFSLPRWMRSSRETRDAAHPFPDPASGKRIADRRSRSHWGHALILLRLHSPPVLFRVATSRFLAGSALQRCSRFEHYSGLIIHRRGVAEYYERLGVIY